MTNAAHQGIQTGNSYVRGIDGLRALAILSVLIYHFDHALLPGGFTGVDVFFVISGYVISKSLATSYTTNFPTFILGFYKRRILRIVPALLFCLVVSSVVSSLFIPTAWLSRPNEETALWAFFGVSNFFLASGVDGYFSERIPFNPFVHTWSLAVEEQFYLLFPLIFYIWLMARNSDSRVRILALLLLPVTALASLIFASYETGVAHHRAFYLLPSRFWELAAGAVLFQFQAHRSRLCKTSAMCKWLLLGGSASLALGFAYADEAEFPFPWALLPVVGALLMIAGTTEIRAASRGVQALIESRAMVFIGRISYSLYLWHWPVFSVFRWTVGLTQPLTGALALSITFALSMFSYYIVETRFRRNKYLKKQANWKIVAGGLASVTASFFVIHLFFKYDDALGMKLTVTTNTCDWAPYYNPYCGSDPKPANGIKMPGKRILVIGDSHAGAYGTMVTEVAASLDASAQIYTQPGCPVAALIRASNDSQVCRDSEDDVLRWVKQHATPGDIVLLASLRVPRLGNQWGVFDEAAILSGNTTPEAIKVRQRALTQAEEFIEKVQALGLHVLMDAPKPVFRAPAFRCSDWFNESNPVCEPGFTVERDILLRHREPTMASLRKLSESHGVFLWDPFPLLCDGPLCSAFEGGRPLFLDGDHLSGYGNRLLVPSFMSQLLTIWTNSAPATLPVSIGERIVFSNAGIGPAYLARGWSRPEATGVWSDGGVAKLVLPLSTSVASGMLVEALPLISTIHPNQNVEIRVNDVLAANVSLTASSGDRFEVAIPDSVREGLAEQQSLLVEFRLPDAARPKDVGINDDLRSLALHLVAITVK